MASKTVGLRRIPKTLQAWQDEVPSVQFPDDIEAAETDSQSVLRQKTASALIEKLRPSEFAAFKMLRPHVSLEIGQMALAGHKICLIVRFAEKAWISPFSEAFAACLHDLCADLDADIPTLSMRTLGVNKRHGEAVFDTDSIARYLREHHVLIPVLSGEDVPPVLEALADLDLDGVPSRTAMRDAVNRRFPGANWRSKKVLPEYVKPADFDLALSRAYAADYAFGLLEALNEASLQTAVRRAADQEKEREREAEAEARLRAKQAAVTKILRPSEPRLEDLHGYGQSATWAADLVRDLHDYRAGKLSWSDVDAGCLLYGPPGTGKTLFATALAASAGLPLIATSYADWQSVGSGHAGDVIKTLRARFADAAANAPCILFIDELDTVGSRGSSNRHDDWFAMIVTALLEALDGTVRREGVVVIGASNHPEKIDSALLRSGRLDRRFEIGLPDEMALARIFAHHLPGGDVEAFDQVATVLAGTTSGADVSRIAREARRVARRAGREIMADDLLSIAMPEDRRSESEQRRVAIHESGHAVVSIVNGHVPSALSLVQTDLAHGGVFGLRTMDLGGTEDFEAVIAVFLAGRAAEEVVLGSPTGGASGDLDRATKVVTQMIGHLGLGGRLATADQVPLVEIEAKLQALYGRTLRLVAEHRASIEALAEIAIDRRVLGHRALMDFARDRGLGGAA